MGASTSTATLALPQFADNDKPTWRGDINGAFQAIDNDAANFRSKVASIALGVTTDSFKLTSGAGDQAAALNAFFADGTLSGIRRVIGTAHIQSKVTIPTGLTVDARKCDFYQDTANITMLEVAGGSRLSGGRYFGKTTDYVPGTGSWTPTSIGVKVNGGSVSNTYLEDLMLSGFGQAAIYTTAAPKLFMESIEAYGPHGMAGITIGAGDAHSIGFYISGTCPDMTARNLRAENYSIGFENSFDSARLTLEGFRARNIPGQHALYLGNADNLSLSDVVGDTINLCLAKLQIFNGNTSDQMAPKVNGVSGVGIGDSVLMVVNTDTDLTSSYHFLAPVINNISGKAANRVLYLSSVRGASVSQIAGFGSTDHTVIIKDAQDTMVENLTSVGSNNAGVLVTTSTGASTKRLTVKGARIYNPGNANGAIKQGVNVGAADAQHVTLDSIHVFADNGFMDYGFSIDASDSSTLRIRNSSSKGHVNRWLRLTAGSTTLRELANNDGDGSQALNYPAAYPVRTGSNGDRTRYACNAQPVVGVFNIGDTVDNIAVAAAGSPGWVCTVTGGAFSSTWAATTAYTVGTQVKTSGGKTLLCTVAGTSGATEPVPPATVGQTVTDGTVTWQYTSSSVATFKARANVAA